MGAALVCFFPRGQHYDHGDGVIACAGSFGLLLLRGKVMDCCWNQILVCSSICFHISTPSCGALTGWRGDGPLFGGGEDEMVPEVAH